MGSWLSYRAACSAEQARDIATSDLGRRCGLATSTTGVGGALKIGDDEAALRDVLEVAGGLAELARCFALRWSVDFQGAPGEVGPEGPEGALRAALHQMRELVDAPRVDRRPPWAPRSTKSFSRAGARKLEARWTAESVRAVCDAIFGDATAAPRHGGRVDARGLDLTAFGRAIPRAKSGRYMGPPIRDVDLSFLVPVRTGFVSFGGMTFENCVLDGLKTTDLAGRFVRCSLRGLAAAQISASVDGCDLSTSRIDGFLPDVREGTFSFARLDRCKLGGRSYTRCRFDDASFAGAELGGTRFEECTFEGASFFDAFYAKTRFTRCAGLDRDRMLESARVMFGHALSTSDDVLLE
jgi:hypothetical protein